MEYIVLGITVVVILVDIFIKVVRFGLKNFFDFCF